MSTATVSSGDPLSEAPGRTSVANSDGRAFLILPLVLVNLTAVWGQAGWAFDAFTPITAGGLFGLTVAILFATAVESIGFFLANMAHLALMADQSSLGLRLGSYAVGLFVGVLNFLHFSPLSLPTGIAFGCLSAISPWLWSIYSRARSRARLASLGLVDARAVRLSTARKILHPVLSYRVIRWAAWAGVTEPAEAVAGWEASTYPELAPEAPEDVEEAQEDAGELTAPLGLVDVDAESKRARVRRLHAEHPELTHEKLAERAGCSERWVRQALAPPKRKRLA